MWASKVKEQSLCVYIYNNILLKNILIVLMFFQRFRLLDDIRRHVVVLKIYTHVVNIVKKMYKLYIKQCFIIYKSIKLVLKERLKKVIIYIYRRKKCVQKFSASVFEFKAWSQFFIKCSVKCEFYSVFFSRVSYSGTLFCKCYSEKLMFM